MYNTKLEEKIDAAAKQWQNVEKKKMFTLHSRKHSQALGAGGGVCYLLKGNMAFGIWKDSLIVRMDKEQGLQILRIRNVRPFVFLYFLLVI